MSYDTHDPLARTAALIRAIACCCMLVGPASAAAQNHPPAAEEDFAERKSLPAEGDFADEKRTLDERAMTQNETVLLGQTGPGQFSWDWNDFNVPLDQHNNTTAVHWAQYARLAAEFCSKRDFVGGHFNGHRKDGFVDLYCAEKGAIWRDVPLTEIITNQWAFTDINAVNWAQANRVAESICAKAGQGFAGGHFNGHMLNGKFGLYCYGGGATWFDASGAELAATGFGFATPRLDDVEWDQAMRAATNFCKSRGFHGGFMNGHHVPNKYGVVCHK